jgi:hypothetical protein
MANSYSPKHVAELINKLKSIVQQVVDRFCVRNKAAQFGPSGRCPAEITGSNQAVGMYVCLL